VHPKASWADAHTNTTAASDYQTSGQIAWDKPWGRDRWLWRERLKKESGKWH